MTEVDWNVFVEDYKGLLSGYDVMILNEIYGVFFRRYEVIIEHPYETPTNDCFKNTAIDMDDGGHVVGLWSDYCVQP